MKNAIIYVVLILLFSPILLAQHTNVVIDAVRSNYPNEPSIKIDPSNTRHLLAASNINNYYSSVDGGETWKSGKLTSSYGVWGDPAIAVDTAGHFYFFHLSNPPSGNWIDRIICQKTTDLGQNWNNGSFMGLNGNKAQDKEWPVIDRRTNNIYVSWTQFDDYGSPFSQDSSHIFFSRSLDAGMTWSEAVRLDQKGGDCIDDDNTVEGAVPCVGPNGEIYIAWAGPEGIVFDRSLDQGNTWLDQDLFVADNPGGWNYSIPGISRCNGLPVTACDTSSGPYNGRIYVNWTDQRNGLVDTDVWLAYSDNQGESWSDAIRVNDDGPEKHQFLSWMDIDQVNGYIYIVFYDRRDYDDLQTDVYLARSTDGGDHFTNFRISESPFIPNKGIFFGDYTNITAHDNVIRPIWTRLHEGELKILTALIDTSALATSSSELSWTQPPELLQNYPNPFSSKTYISFKLHRADTLDLIIFDSHGKKVAELFTSKKFGEGKHVLQLNEEVLQLNKGVYYYVLRSADGSQVYKKMIQLE